MGKTIRDLLALTAGCFLLTLAVWTPYYLKLPNFYGLNFTGGMESLYQNFDGLEYVVIAKTYYNPDLLAGVPQDKKPNYYPSHFPGYSGIINLFAPLFGYLKSMLFVTQISTLLAAFAFYFLVRDFKLSSKPLLLSLVFLVLPARWVIVHSVGSSEPLFIFLTITAIYFFLKFEQSSKLLWITLAGVFGALAQITRPPGILLFLALALFFHLKVWQKLRSSGFVSALKLHIRYLPLLLIPISLLGIFYIYQVQMNDFWAYFHSGDNIHLTFPPFQVFNKDQFWVGDIWLEDIIYVFILGILAAMMLWKNNITKPLGIYLFVYLLAGISIAHRDISRYLLPVAPFVLIAFERVLTSKEFKIVLVIVALGIYLYSQNYIIHNTAPINNLMDFN